MVAGLVLLSLSPAWAPAQTGGSSVPVTGGSWYWAAQIGSTNGPTGPVAPPAPLPTPDVPAGDFPVSVVAGQTDKISFLQLDSSAITAGSTVSTLVLTLHEDSNGGNLNAAMGTVEARAVTGFLSSGDTGKPIANAPSYDTIGPGVAGNRKPDGTWTFELAPIATRWANGELSNNGIALVPKTPVQGQTYEVVWFGPGGTQAPSTNGLFTPGSGQSPAAAPAGETAAPVDSGAPVAIAPDVSVGSTAADTPSASVSGGETPSPSAATAAPVVTGSGSTAAVRRIGSSHPAPPWSFYLAIIAAIVLIGASTLSLGDLGEPEPERQGGVLRALERRTQEVPPT